jgi:hypothetical protein
MGFLQGQLRQRSEWLVGWLCGVAEVPSVFSYVEYCDMLLKNTKGVFPIEGFLLEVYLREFTGLCVILDLFRVFLCSLNGGMYE